MTYNFKSNLSEALEQLLKIGTDYNVIIQTGESSNLKEFHAHSNILRCRSVHFNMILSDENIEKKDGKYIIKLPNISSQTFNDILKYLYTDQINVTNKTGTELLEFMIVTDELMLENLTKLIEGFFISNYQQFLQDPTEILQITYNHKSLVNLHEFCLDKICFRPKILFDSDKFTQLSTPLLETILKRDDLNLKGVEIWKNIIKWGLAQDQMFAQNVSEWNNDHINILKRILHEFIPLIKFYEISHEDYLSNVKPYEEILPKKLRDNILKSYTIPGDESTPELRDKISKSHMIPGDESTPELRDKISKSHTIPGDESTPELRDKISKSYTIPGDESRPELRDNISKSYMIPGDESTPKLRNKISKSYMTPGDESTPKLINNISKSYMIFADESMLKLRDNILKSYMIPRNESTPNHNHLDSRLIDRRHIALFKNWIGRKNGKTNYTFNLLYRASRDDNTASAFHAKCDNKGATIIVVKVTNTKQIVGGYNPLFWDSSNSCKSTKYSFIFSFTNKNDLQSANVAYSKGDENSIRSYSHWGPVFGTDLHAAYIPTRDSWRSNVCSYPTLDLPRIFKIDDYEVFQVI